MLFHQYNRIENMQNLDAIISKVKLGVAVTPEDHPD